VPSVESHAPILSLLVLVDVENPFGLETERITRVLQARIK